MKISSTLITTQLCFVISVLSMTCLQATAQSHSLNSGANRYAYLDESCDPYYVGTNFPKLITPQWIGEEGVDAVVVLAIDDMRNTATYERYLRPILDRLKEIEDGRAPLSIMTNSIDPKDPQLQTWVTEGVMIDVHTIDHPCPILANGNFGQSKSTYDRCVELMNQIEGNRAVAFRTPCCDSLNTPSPRMFAEIINKTTPNGQFLSIDSSVFNILTPTDPEIHSGLYFEKNGEKRFRKYIPFKSFVNTIENYPYPYPIGNMCWEFPCVVPSDWEAQNIQRPNNPKTVEDMKVALDMVVQKKGVYNLVFHPHNWIRNDQIVEVIDHAAKKYGKRVKFLSFADALKRINKNFLQGHPLRAKDGSDNGVRILDINNDGYLDVIAQNNKGEKGSVCFTTQVDNDGNVKFGEKQSLPFKILSDKKFPLTRFGVTYDEQAMLFSVYNDHFHRWDFREGRWVETPNANLKPIEKHLANEGKDGKDGKVTDLRNCRFVAIDGSGTDLVTLDSVFQHQPFSDTWSKRKFDLPRAVAHHHGENGLRFVDLNGDKNLDFIYSDENNFAVKLFVDDKTGWSKNVISGNRTDAKKTIPIISRVGKNNGAFFHSNHMWVQNEDTNRLADLVQRISFVDIIRDEKNPQKNLGQPVAKSPADALTTFKLDPELEIQLVACEPQVTDPVAFDWAMDGSLWVVSMSDYPLGVDGKGTPGGKLTKLSDWENGRYKTSKIFRTDLPFPTGVKAWGKGVIVSTAPEVFYLEDTNNDGDLDKQITLLKGFSEGNQQHRVNGIRWGLEGWLHIANGDSGGRITSFDFNGKEVSTIEIGGRDLRYNPFTGEAQTTTGQTQFGRNRDDFGNWVGGNNSNPMWQYVLDDQYLSRNKDISTPNVRHQVSDQPGPAVIFPTSKTLERFNDFDRANRFTSACSPMFYRDTKLGKELYGNAFICEPVHNLIHREIVTRDGIFLKSTRPDSEKTSEFLTSTDSWFRPVMIRTGPDGSLWVADMYRLVIEHPEWIPADWQKRLDLRSGHNKGRIYRIVRKSNPPKQLVPRMRKHNWMDSPNGTVRDMAHAAILRDHHSLSDRNSNAAQTNHKVLEARLKIDQKESAQIQLQKQHLLASLGDSVSSTAESAFGSRNPHMIVHLLKRLGEEGSATEKVGAKGLLQMHDEKLKSAIKSDKAIELQACYSAAAIAEHSPWFLTFIFNEVKMDHYTFTALLSGFKPETVTKHLDRIDLSKLTEEQRGTAIRLFLRTAPESTNHFVSKALLSKTDPIAATAAILQHVPNPRLQDETIAELSKITASARKQIADNSSDERQRRDAAALFGFVPDEMQRDFQTLIELISPSQSLATQKIAVENLYRFADQKATDHLISNWKSLTPTIKNRVYQEIATRKKLAPKIVAAIDTDRLPIDLLTPQRRAALENILDDATKLRLAKLAPSPTSSDRKAIIETYASKLNQSGNVTNGRQVFTKNCANCHLLDGLGKAIGPDLLALTDRSPSTLLNSILDPNRAIEQKYLNYIVETTAGKQFSGVLSQETSSSIKLLTADQKEIEITRSDIESLDSSGVSYMPVGLEKEIDAKQMNDLIAFLRANHPKSKSFPNNKPAIVTMQKDGAYIATASIAAIYGPSIVFEQKYRNLGFWSSPSDYARWPIQVKSDGKFNVIIDYAVAEGASGDTMQLQIADKKLTAKIPSTGTWDDYQKMDIGEVELTAGNHEIIMKSLGNIRFAMLDLKAIHLEPIE